MRYNNINIEMITVYVVHRNMME